MPIPQLNNHGLLPPGVWDCTLGEISDALCWNDHRQKLFAGLTDFIAREWNPLGISCPIIIDGSFVRSKPIPDDIDVLVDLSGIDSVKSLALGLALRFHSIEHKAAYKVDVWAQYPDRPDDILIYFQYIGDKSAAELRLDSKHPKGVLRIQA